MTKITGYTLISKACERGYTLIEILVAITIVGILFSVGYVGFRDFSRRQSINSSARQLKSDIKFAVELASSGKKPAGCTGSLDGYNFRVNSAASYSIEAKCTLAGVSQIVNVKTEGLINQTIVNIPALNPIVFKTVADGTNIPAGQSVTFTISQPAVSYTASVIVGENGDIR